MDIIGINIPIEDAIENINRIAELEDLCRELYEEVERDNWVTAERHYKSRMKELGLLEKNDD